MNAAAFAVVSSAATHVVGGYGIVVFPEETPLALQVSPRLTTQRACSFVLAPRRYGK